MLPRRIAEIGFVVVMYVALLPSSSWSQSQTGGVIGGVVKDPTGAVLPGVTVEASSPALIEKVRTAVTDGEGVYKIINLNPGAYAVTFALPGFSTVKREGIELTGGFTATVNAELRVGQIEETVLVSGQSPLVDVQSATQRQTITTQLIAELPSARDASHMAVLIPGVIGGGGFNQDVGGTARPTGTHQVVIHGSKANDWPNVHDGMQFGSMYNLGSGSAGVWQANPAAVEEYTIATSGAGADASASGVRINIIPKQGGNNFSGYFLANFTNDAFLSSNVDDELVARGALRTDPLKKLWDVNPGFGGPLVRDKVWFYASYRYTGLNEHRPNLFYDTNPDDFVFTADPRPLYAPQISHHQNLRLTWQTSRTSKLALYGDNVPKDRPVDFLLSGTGPVAYEASTHFTVPVDNLFQGTWTKAGSKVLIEIGETYRPDHWDYGKQVEVPWTNSSVNEQSTNTTFRAPPSRIEFNAYQQNGKASVSYVTGSHNMKVGSQWFSGSGTTSTFLNNDTSYGLLNGAPVSLTMRTTPFAATERIKLNLGLYAQEQWTTRRLTLNLGLRFDYLNGYVPEQHAPPARFLPVARNFARIDHVPNQKDIVPRVGAAYDLFGTGKTALKGFVGKYLESEGVNIARAVNPLTAAAATTATRAWTDGNGNFVPDCDLLNPAANGECGINGNANFGRVVVPIRYDPDAVTGWGTRGWNWEVSGGVDHELRSGLSTSLSYHRRWFGNLRITDNLLVTPADYDPFCITAPVDSRLPDSGQQVCGLYDITPAKFGLNDNVVVLARDEFGKRSEVYNGVDFNLNVRFPNGLLVQGGTSTGRTALDTCSVVDSPQDLRFCETKPPFQTQVKLLGIYPLPWWGVQTSMTFQSVPGPQITASYAAPASSVIGLGRPLAGGVRTVTVPLVAPGTMYGERLNQVDLRLTRPFRVAGSRVEPQLDFYNLFNANPILTQNNTYGSAWQNVTMFLKGRLLKVGLQVTF